MIHSQFEQLMFISFCENINQRASGKVVSNQLKMEWRINIVDLPYDVLRTLFSILKHKDQINLALAHPNLGDIFIIRYKRRFLYIYLDEISSKIWDPFFTQFGHLVNGLCWYTISSLKVLDSAVKYCKSLQKIRFSIQRSDTPQEIGDRIRELKNLKTIFIRNANFNHITFIYLRNPEAIFQSFQQLSKLRRLTISNFQDSACKYYESFVITSIDFFYFLDLQIRELTQLEEFNIRHSYQSLDIGYICAKLRNLRILYHNGDLMNADSLQALPQNCPLLEKLTIFSRSTEIRIPYFPKLKELTIGAHIPNHPPINVTLSGFGYIYAKQLDKLVDRIYNAKRCEDEKLMKQLSRISEYQPPPYRLQP